MNSFDKFERRVGSAAVAGVVGVGIAALATAAVLLWCLVEVVQWLVKL